MQRTTPTDLLRRGLFVLAFDTVLAAVVALFSPPAFGFAHSLAYAQCIGLCTWLLIEATAALLQRRLGLEPGRLATSVLVMLGVGSGYLLGSLLADRITGLSTARIWSDTPLLGMRSMAVSALAGLTVALLFIGHAHLGSARAEAEAARRLAAEAQLRLLQSQLEPHMLFNTLANLRVLIGVDAARAQAMLDRLNAFLRATLAASRLETHPLSAEFERLADYLALMQVRMGPRLQVRLDLPVALAHLNVPPLLLQPLVENAIQHGLEPARGGGRLEISAQRSPQHLVLHVADSGCDPCDGDAPPRHAGLGFGLAQVRERLAVLYGGAASLALDRRVEGGGTLATIAIPLASLEPVGPREPPRPPRLEKEATA